MLNHKNFLFIFDLTPDVDQWTILFEEVKNFAIGMTITIISAVILFKILKYIRKRKIRE